MYVVMYVVMYVFINMYLSVYVTCMYTISMFLYYVCIHQCMLILFISIHVCIIKHDHHVILYSVCLYIIIIIIAFGNQPELITTF